MLSDATLEQLKSSWEEMAAPIAGALRDGLDDDAMDALTLEAGLRLPEEARRWWRWHDGAYARPGFAPEELGPGRSFSPLAAAVQDTMSIRESLRTTAERFGTPPVYGGVWMQDWLVLVRSSRPVVVSCAHPNRAIAPVYIYNVVEPDTTVMIESMDELVRAWISLYDAGAWRYSAADERWHVDPNRVHQDSLEGRLMG